MKGLVKRLAAPGLWLEEMAEPTPQADEVLIKTRKTSICGTDVHIYKWDGWAQKNVPVPMVIGHEFVGEIAAVGNDVAHLKVGMRVTGEGHLLCGVCSGCRHGKRHLCSGVAGLGYHCRHCRHKNEGSCEHLIATGYHSSGCFADYFTMPAVNVFPLPEAVPDDIAAIFDPFGNAVHTAQAIPLLGESVLITGGGPLGMMAAAIARRGGARHVIVTDVNPRRLALAARVGATTTVNVAERSLKEVLAELGLEEGVSAGMEMSGNGVAFQSMLEACRPGATVALLGIFSHNPVAIDWDLVVFKMLTIKGIYGREIFATWDTMTQLVEGGLDLSPIITHHYDAVDYEKGFEAMLSGAAAKVILKWS